MQDGITVEGIAVVVVDGLTDGEIIGERKSQESQLLLLLFFLPVPRASLNSLHSALHSRHWSLLHDMCARHYCSAPAPVRVRLADSEQPPVLWPFIRPVPGVDFRTILAGRFHSPFWPLLSPFSRTAGVTVPSDSCPSMDACLLSSLVCQLPRCPWCPCALWPTRDRFPVVYPLGSRPL